MNFRQQLSLTDPRYYEEVDKEHAARAKQKEAENARYCIIKKCRAPQVYNGETFNTYVTGPYTKDEIKRELESDPFLAMGSYTVEVVPFIRV